LIWKYTTDGPISVKPVIYQGAVVVASDDGNVYGFDPATGARKWQASVGKTPNDIAISDNALIISTTKGKIAKIGQNGVIQWQIDLSANPNNASYVYGASANAKEIFASANNGVFLIEKNGSVRSRLAEYNDSVVSAPAAGVDYFIYGRGKTLYRISDTGTIQWKTTLPSTQNVFWLSRPVIEGSVVYIGGLDKRLHAFILTSGLEPWSATTRGWILGTPLIKDGSVYFGSNDGAIYAVDNADGNARWSAQTSLAIQTQPEAGTMGGKDVVFAGGMDKSVYAISRDSGEIVWKGSAEGAAGSPLFYQNKVTFGSQDGKIYAYSTEKACSITSPIEAQVVGLKELVVSGKYVSEAGGATVLVRINDGEWLQADTSDVDWSYDLDPKAMLSAGLNTISCQVSDSMGEESGTLFTTVTVTQDPTIPLSELKVSVSPDIIEGKNFTIYVNDGDDGSPVDRFNITIEGKSALADRNYTLVIPQSGTYKATVKKIGFKDASVNINVNPSGVSPVYLGIAVLLIAVIIWQLWTRFLAQRFAPKRR